MTNPIIIIYILIAMAIAHLSFRFGKSVGDKLAMIKVIGKLQFAEQKVREYEAKIKELRSELDNLREVKKKTGEWIPE